MKRHEQVDISAQDVRMIRAYFQEGKSVEGAGREFGIPYGSGIFRRAVTRIATEVALVYEPWCADIMRQVHIRHMRPMILQFLAELDENTMRDPLF